MNKKMKIIFWLILSFIFFNQEVLTLAAGKTVTLPAIEDYTVTSDGQSIDTSSDLLIIEDDEYGSGYSESGALIRFDLTGVQTTNVASAYLKLYVTSIRQDDPNVDAGGIVRIATGTGRYAYGAWASYPTSYWKAENGLNTINVTSQVKEWLSGNSVNNGFIIEPNEVDFPGNTLNQVIVASMDHRTVSYRPVLIINYAPETPQTLSGTVNGLNWTNTEGRGRIQLSWEPVTDTDGYKVWVFDGYVYRGFDVGNTTSWDSAVWKTYPSESQLDSYGNNTQSGNLFNTVKGGLDLRDDVNKLYLKTKETTYDSAHNYFFKVSAYNSYGESPQSDAFAPFLPNRTDTTVPTGTVNINSGSAYTGSTSVTINLSCTDPLVTNYTPETSDDASGLSQMRFSNDGVTWSAWETYSATKSWTLNAGAGSKTIYCQVKDTAGNTSSNLIDTIYLDTVKPTGSIKINNDAVYTTSTAVILQLTGTDSESGLYQMRFSNDNTNWGSWVAYSSSHSHTLSSSNGTKTVYLQLKDHAGNISNTYSDTIILDTVAPTGAISINDGADYTNNVNVTLNISYSDAISGPYQMQISTSSDFSGASWINVNNIANITLTAGDGTNTIYARFKDYAGNISSGVSDTIILDRVNPTGSITVLSEDGLTKTSSTKVILTITGSDDRSGLAGIQLSNNGVNWGPLETLTSPREWNVSVGAGTKTVYLKLIDNAGNEYVVSDDIYLVDDVIGPTVTLLINGGATSTTNKLVTLNISAFDNFSKLNEMQMRFSNNGYLWSAWEPFSDIKENWDITNAAYGGTDSAGTKSIYVQVLDAAQNTGLARADIGYSTQTPTGTVSLNMGIPGTFNGEEVRFVSNANINLSLNFSNVTEMRVSMDGVSYSPWIPYESTLPITLPKGDGLTVVGVQVRNINKVISDTIKYKVVMDTTPPNIFVKTSNGATATKTGSIELTILVTDNISIDSFKYKINDGSWNSLPSNGKITVSGLAEGFHQIQVSVMDQAGNISKQTINVWSL